MRIYRLLATFSIFDPSTLFEWIGEFFGWVFDKICGWAWAILSELPAAHTFDFNIFSHQNLVRINCFISIPNVLLALTFYMVWGAAYWSSRIILKLIWSG